MDEMINNNFKRIKKTCKVHSNDEKCEKKDVEFNQVWVSRELIYDIKSFTGVKNRDL